MFGVGVYVLHYTDSVLQNAVQHDDDASDYDDVYVLRRTPLLNLRFGRCCTRVRTPVPSACVRHLSAARLQSTGPGPINEK